MTVHIICAKVLLATPSCHDCAAHETESKSNAIQNLYDIVILLNKWMQICPDIVRRDSRDALLISPDMLYKGSNFGHKSFRLHHHH